jgi:hypothetical protein
MESSTSLDGKHGKVYYREMGARRYITRYITMQTEIAPFLPKLPYSGSKRVNQQTISNKVNSNKVKT